MSNSRSVRRAAARLKFRLGRQGNRGTHIFAGGGGDAVGFEAAGFEVGDAYNHKQVCVDTLRANFPSAIVERADLDTYDMRRLRTDCDILVGSPICTEVSPADGVYRPSRDPAQLTIDGEEPLSPDMWLKTRATAWDILGAVEVHDYAAVICENVPRFALKWPLFRVWLSGFEALDYNVQVISLCAAHVGDVNNLHAPQWRKRIVIVATKKGIPKPDLELRPLAWCRHCEMDVHAIQSWRNGNKIGEYGRQYDYVCPRSQCAHKIVHPYIRPASTIIDWDDLGTRIGDMPPQKGKPRGLSENTLRKTGIGLARHRTVTGITVTHSGPSVRSFPVWEGAFPTQTVRIGEALVWPSDAFWVELRGGGSSTRSIHHPLSTVTAGGNNHGLVLPHRPERNGVVDLDTIPDVMDCRYRTIRPREQFGAQRFPDDYIVHGNVGEQTAQAGNAVPCNVAQWVAERVMAVIA